MMGRMMSGWILLAFLATSSFAQDAAMVEAPVFKPGDSWTYQRNSKYDRNRTGTFKVTVTAVTKTGYTTSQTVIEGDVKASKAIYTAQMNPTYDNGRKKEPFAPHFSFPLMPGKQWQGQWQYTKRKRRKKDKHFTAIMKSRVEGWETVKTPAGEFRALRITFEASHRNQSGRERITKGIRWYCPEVRQVVRTELKDDGGKSREEIKELIDYQPAF